MVTNYIRKAVCAGMGALLLAASVMASPSAKQGETAGVSTPAWNFQREASELLENVCVLSGKLRTDADRLESFPRSRLGWQTHADQLALVKGHINQMGTQLDRLQQIRHTTSPWQQQAIDRAVPVAVELASRTQAAIEHLNENNGYLFAPSYTDHLTTIAEQATTLEDSVSSFMEYSTARENLEELERKLEISRS